MAKAKKQKAIKMYYGTVQVPFKTSNHTYNVGDIYQSDHEGSFNYLITTKKLKK